MNAFVPIAPLSLSLLMVINFSLLNLSDTIGFLSPLIINDDFEMCAQSCHLDLCSPFLSPCSSQETCIIIIIIAIIDFSRKDFSV